MSIAQKWFSLCLCFVSMFTIIVPHHVYACESRGALFAIASDSSGNFVTVWGEKVDDIPVIRASTLTSGGSWSEPVTISNPDTYSICPLIEMDENGNAVALWRTVTKDDPKYFLEAAKSMFGSGKWNAPETISDNGVMISTNNIELEVSPNGNIVAIWGRVIVDDVDPTISHKELRASMSTFNTSWSAPITISTIRY